MGPEECICSAVDLDQTYSTALLHIHTKPSDLCAAGRMEDSHVVKNFPPAPSLWFLAQLSSAGLAWLLGVSLVLTCVMAGCLSTVWMYVWDSALIDFKSCIASQWWIVSDVQNLPSVPADENASLDVMCNIAVGLKSSHSNLQNCGVLANSFSLSTMQL